MQYYQGWESSDFLWSSTVSIEIWSKSLVNPLRPLQFIYLSYKLWKKKCQTPKKKKKVDFGVLRTKVV